MKKVLTKYHGELPLNELICIHFPDGIPALEQYTKYTLLPFDDSDFFILQSLEEAEIAFLVVDIFKIESTYDYVVPKIQQETMKMPKHWLILFYLGMLEKVV